MIDFVKKYWIETFFASIVTGLSFSVKLLFKRAKKEVVEQQAIKQGLIAILHDRLHQVSYQLINKGTCTIADLENVEFLYKSYHELGGNGVCTEMYNRVKSLPFVTEDTKF